MKASIETVHEALQGREVEPDKIQQILKDIEAAEAAKLEEERANREPAVKKQFVLVVSDPNGVLPEGLEIVGWAVQIPEDDCTSTTLERIHRAAYEFNRSKKGRKYPVKTIGEAAEAVGARFLKEQDVWIKNKIPAAVVVTTNLIPMEVEG